MGGGGLPTLPRSPRNEMIAFLCASVGLVGVVVAVSLRLRVTWPAPGRVAALGTSPSR